MPTREQKALFLRHRGKVKFQKFHAERSFVQPDDKSVKAREHFRHRQPIINDHEALFSNAIHLSKHASDDFKRHFMKPERDGDRLEFVRRKQKFSRIHLEETNLLRAALAARNPEHRLGKVYARYLRSSPCKLECHCPRARTYIEYLLAVSWCDRLDNRSPRAMKRNGKGVIEWRPLPEIFQNHAVVFLRHRSSPKLHDPTFPQLSAFPAIPS